MGIVKQGRGAGFNTPNRFEPLHLEPVPGEEPEPSPTRYFLDSTRTVLAANDSPDLPFKYSINPYRGCEHGCIYCYARPTHEYLGFSAGLDFESRILVKRDAPRLLEEAFHRRSWRPQTVVFSGNTDCYQPIERRLELTGISISWSSSRHSTWSRSVSRSRRSTRSLHASWNRVQLHHRGDWKR